MATTTKREKKENVPAQLAHLLDRPIAVHRILVKLTKSIPAGILLGQCLYWHMRTKHEDGWFYKTKEDWEDEITLTRGELDRARLILRNLNILKEKRCGMPSRMWYRIDLDELQEKLSDYQRIHGIQYRLRSESEAFDLKTLSALKAMEITGLHELSESAVNHVLQSSHAPHATRSELIKILSPLLKMPENTVSRAADLSFSYFKVWRVSDGFLATCRKLRRLNNLEDNLLDYEKMVKLETTSINWGLIWDWVGDPFFQHRVFFAKINGVIYAIDAEKEGKAFYQWVENLNKATA